MDWLFPETKLYKIFRLWGKSLNEDPLKNDVFILLIVKKRLIWWLKRGEWD